MDGRERAAAPSAACVDDERLAAYVDGRLDPAERSAVEVHLAGCRRCRDVAAETAAFLRTEKRAGLTPFHRAKWPIAAVVAAALAATVVLMVRLGFVASRAPAMASRPELAELVAAAAHEPTRLAEGRLTGGFAYKPAPVQTRGAGDPTISPELKIAAAKIEQTMRGKDTADATAALGDSYLAVGDLDRAVENLETAVDQKPDDARYQNDLSAAYIARASRRDRADDWPKALAAAERAAKRDPNLVEPCFNRALALEGLHLDGEAADTWSACAARDPRSAWANEARQRRDAIRNTLRTPKPQSNQERREEIEDRLLVTWAESEKAGDVASADAVLDSAERAAAVLVAAGGDTMARDEVALIKRSPHRSASRLALVDAHLAYGRARQAFLAERLNDASRDMAAAAAAFARADSSYKYWAPIFRAISQWVEGSGDESLTTLSSVPIDHLPESYYHLRGRLAWTKAAAFTAKGRFDLELPLVEYARDLFRQSGEIEYASVNAVAAAEADWLVGTQERTWVNMIEALASFDALRSGGGRASILDRATYLALRDKLPEVALAFQEHLLGSSQRARSTKNGPLDATAYIRHGQTLGRMGQTDAALADLDRAAVVAERMANISLRAWMLAETDTVRAEVLATKDPRAAIQAADAALAYHRRTASTTVRESELLVSRAKAYEASSDFAAAAEDYEAAIAALEQDEDGVARPQQRKAAYDQQRIAVQEAVRFHAIVRHDDVTALGIAERARARVLRQTLAGRTAPAPNPALLHRSLPRDVAVLYYVMLPERVLGWVLTTDQSFQFTAEIDAGQFRRVMHRLQQRIANDATAADVASELQYLQSFVRPALPALSPETTLVIVPDQGLEAIPFAAVRDLNGAPLIARHPLLLAPSYSTLVLASERLAGFQPDGVVAIGDGHDPGEGPLPRLIHADAEAMAVARMYPRAAVFTGSKATVQNVFTASQPVLHFAGHTISNPDFPFLSRLLLAPESTGRDRSGVLLASDLADRHLDKTKVVVLASCESAAGRFIPGEGFDNVARFFLDAGVPAVVASLWPVDDSQGSLLVEFHKQLRATRDVARALRAAQMKEIGDGPAHQPLRRWAGFVAFGGVNAKWTGKDGQR